MERATQTIDVTGKVLGRIAVQIAVFLRGKNHSNFRPHEDLGDIVVVRNAEKIKITGRKLQQKKYRWHSRFPGGLKTKSMKEIFAENPEELLKKAVYGMLPSTKLRALQIKRLRFEK